MNGHVVHSPVRVAMSYFVWRATLVVAGQVSARKLTLGDEEIKKKTPFQGMANHPLKREQS